MNPLDRLRNNSNKFTNSENKIALYILDNPIRIVQLTADEIAAEAGSSKSVFIRLCQKIGYQGYVEFRYALSRYLVSHTTSNETTNDFIQVIPDIYSEQIKKITQTVSLSDIKEVSKLILNSNRVKIFGYNRTGLSAQQFRMRLAKIGMDSEYSTDLLLMNDLVSNLSSNDLVIIFSIKGGSYYEKIISQLKTTGARGILVTMNSHSLLRKELDYTITLPLISTISERFLDDQAIFFIFIEILLAGLSEYKA